MNFVDFLFNDSPFQPGKVFLLGKEEMTYGELYDRVQSLSSYLNSEYGEDKNMAICSSNNAFFIIAYLSIIKSGNICIPIDPSIAYNNLAYIVEQSSPAVIFKSILSKTDVKEFKSDIITETELDEILSETAISDSIECEFNEFRVAEIIFTSGSTGRPKGVMLSHLNLISNTKSIVEYLKLGVKDRVLVVLPFYYCYGLSLLHTHLKCKGSIVINSSFIFLGSVVNDLLKFKCTGFAGVPSHYQILLRKTKSFVTTEFPDLRYVTQAGGKLHDAFIKEFTEVFKDIAFYVMYGQTEATARLSYLPPELLTTKIGSIGKGIPGVILRVVNQNFNNVKPGEIGEIVVKGNNVMLGYYKDEEMTKLSFSNGWLKTGDLATVDDQGYIFLTARAKEIIKIRGNRVSPKEIEGIISMMKEVIDCSVLAVEDDLEGEALQANIVLRDDCKGKTTEKEILSFCAKHMELFKIPSKIAFIEKMEINNAGKKVKKVNNEDLSKSFSI